LKSIQDESNVPVKRISVACPVAVVVALVVTTILIESDVAPVGNVTFVDVAPALPTQFSDVTELTFEVIPSLGTLIVSPNLNTPQ
jgi:hypothetical protein